MSISTKVPSSNFEDLKRDVEDATKWVNGEAPFANRAGEILKPIKIINNEAEKLFKEQFEQFEHYRGFTESGDFSSGFTITERQQIAKYNAEWYRWDGILPKAVQPGSSPALTGGVGSGAWLSVGDATLRSGLADPDSTVPIAGIEAWILSEALTKGKGTAFAQKVLAKSAVMPVRIMMDGTSISTFSNSPNKLLVEALKDTYGDAQLEQIYLAGLGGSYTNSHRGWKKQPFGGIFYHRLRGDTDSIDFELNVYGSRVELLYSTETDGGVWSFIIDGAEYIVNSAGLQTYGNKLVVDLPLGAHKIIFKKPTSGYAYPEHVFVTRGLNGIEVIDGCFGGSALQQHMNVRAATGQQVAGVPVYGFNGVDAVFNRDDVDLVIYSGSVNDAGSYVENTYLNAFSRLTSTTKSRNVPLVIQAEMAGHYARPTVQPNHNNFKSIKKIFSKAAASHKHICVVDWDDLTRLDDLNEYAEKYYPTVTSGQVTGSISGDYIHPNNSGHSVGAAAMCFALGVSPPNRETWQQMLFQRSFKLKSNTDKNITINDNGESKVATTAGYAARIYSGYLTNCPLLTLVVDGKNIRNMSRFPEFLNASNTADEDGKFVQYSNSAASLFTYTSANAGTKFTLTFKVKGSGSIVFNTGKAFVDNFVILDSANTSNRTFVFDTANEIGFITTEWIGSSNNDFIVLTGKFYEINVTETNGIPVTNCGDRYSKRNVFYPDVLLDDDPDFNNLLLGQGYFNQYTSGVLIGKALRFDTELYASEISSGSTTTVARFASVRPVGMYRCTDRIQAGYRQLTLGGTVTSKISPHTGGLTENTNTNPVMFSASNFNIAGEPVFTLAIANVGIISNGHRISFFNPTSNKTLYLSPEGNWVNENIFIPSLDGLIFGETFTLSFSTTGLISSIGRNDPTFRLELMGGAAANGGLARPVVVKGKQCMI